MSDYKKHLILSGSPIRVALSLLDKLAQDAILFVVDERDILIGALTDGDVRRGLLREISIDQSINEIIRDNPRFIRKGKDNIQKVLILSVQVELFLHHL